MFTFLLVGRMRTKNLLIKLLLIATGCSKPSATQLEDVVLAAPAELKQVEYKTLTERPDDMLDSIKSSYPVELEKFHAEWTEKASTLPLDGQRAIKLPEVACYADVMCHPIEYSLRVATLDYIERNLQTADVVDALNWVSHSYKSALPLDEPNDHSGHLRGILVDAMKVRMTEYARELLEP